MDRHGDVRFLRAIGTPYAVITDGDPNAGAGRTGVERVNRIATALGGTGTDAERLGLFRGEFTLEIDLYNASQLNRDAIHAALAGFGRTATNADEALAAISAVSKGRFAQRLAATVDTRDAPAYVGRALEHLTT